MVEPSPPDDALVGVGLRAPNAYALCQPQGDVFVIVDVASKEVALQERLPLNLAVVIDRSGSMQAEGKLEQVKNAASFLVRNMQHSDVLAVIAYDDRVDVISPASELADTGNVLARIDALEPRGMTYVEGGLRAGFQEVAKHLKTNQINRVVLLSDGLANVGLSEPRELARIAAELASQGISTTAMGVGLEYSEETMMLLAEYGHGNYHFIANAEQVPEIFQRELRELKAVVALGTELEIDAPQGTTLERVYGFDDVRVGEGRLAVPLGDLFSGDGRRVVLHYRTASATSSDLPFSARVRYRPAAAPDQVSIAPAALEIRCTNDVRTLASHENAAVRDEVDLVVNAHVVDDAMRDVSRGDRELAKRKLDARLQQAEVAAQRSNDPAFKQQVTKMREARGRLDELDAYGVGSAEVQHYVKGNRAESKSQQKKRVK